MTITRPLFPLAIDSTMLGTFRSCPQKMFRSYIEHWKPKSDSVHLIAGGAFASGIEEARKCFFEQGKSAEDSVALGLKKLLLKYGGFECPPDSAKSAERTAGALEFYFENYPLDTDPAVPVTFPGGARGIEFSFAQPLPIRHPVTGDPLLYTGRSDMIAHWASGQFVFDEKTTTSLGARWANQWDLRSQFTGYCWASREGLGLTPSGVVVRGVSILKTKYETAQAITYRSDFEIDRWLAQTCRDIQRMIACWEAGYWDYNLDHACTEYSGCHFAAQICKSVNPESWLPMHFERKVWDPLLREEMSVEEYERRITDAPR